MKRNRPASPGGLARWSREALVDSGAFFAIAAPDDSHHQSARLAFARAAHESIPLFTTNFVVAETYALFNSRRGPHVARAWLRDLRLGVVRVTEADEAAARELLLRHDDKAYSYTDATSFAVMTRLGVRLALAFDQHFAQHGFDLLR